MPGRQQTQCVNADYRQPACRHGGRQDHAVLHQYTEQNQSFTQHYSGGNQFRTGMFSLLYGLQGSYGDARIFNSTSPIMTQSFKQAGYQLGLFIPETNLNLRSAQAMFNDFTPSSPKKPMAVPMRTYAA